MCRCHCFYFFQDQIASFGLSLLEALNATKRVVRHYPVFKRLIDTGRSLKIANLAVLWKRLCYLLLPLWLSSVCLGNGLSYQNNHGNRLSIQGARFWMSLTVCNNVQDVFKQLYQFPQLPRLSGLPWRFSHIALYNQENLYQVYRWRWNHILHFAIQQPFWLLSLRRIGASAGFSLYPVGFSQE